MATTPNIGLYVPEKTTPISPLSPVLGAMQASTDEYLNRRGSHFANNGVRDSEIPAPVVGDYCTVSVGDGFEFQAYTGSTWATVWSSDSMDWVELLADTGWVSTGLAIVPASGWTVTGYNLRKQGVRIHGRVGASRDSSITFNSKGDLSGGGPADISAFTLPTGWNNGSPFATYLEVVKTGSMNMTAVSEANGRVAVTHGIPDQTLAANTEVFFFIDHDIN